MAHLIKNVEKMVRDYILESFLFSDDPEDLDNAASFLDMGILDSTGLMEVVFFLEAQYSIAVNDEEMLPENFDSVDNILAYLATKQVV